jgi:hypothetical protein
MLLDGISGVLVVAELTEPADTWLAIPAELALLLMAT